MNRLNFLVMLPVLFGLTKVNGQATVGAERAPNPCSVLKLYAGSVEALPQPNLEPQVNFHALWRTAATSTNFLRK